LLPVVSHIRDITKPGAVKDRILIRLTKHMTIITCLQTKLTYFKNTIFRSSLPPVVCRRAHVLFTLFVLVCLYIVVSNIYRTVVFALFSFTFCLVYQMLSISLDWLSLRFFLTFIDNVISTPKTYRSVTWLNLHEWMHL
jgi:hypothetical protein